VTKDEEIVRMAVQLDGLLDSLRANVDALNEILTRPASGDGEGDGRLVAQ
jgi:hypothetical protein